MEERGGKGKKVQDNMTISRIKMKKIYFKVRGISCDFESPLVNRLFQH